MAFPRHVLEGERVGGRDLPLHIRPLVSSRESTTLMTSSNPNDFPKTPSPNTIALGIRVITHEFRGDTNIQSITDTKYLEGEKGNSETGKEKCDSGAGAE